MRRCLFCAAILLLTLSSACSMFESENRRTLNWLDASWTPESPGARAAMVPVAVPVGLVGLGVDALVVHPVMSIDDAWGDTVDVLWTYDDESSLRRVLVAPFAAVATPVVFTGDWLWRCLFAIDPRDEDDG